MVKSKTPLTQAQRDSKNEAARLRRLKAKRDRHAIDAMIDEQERQDAQAVSVVFQLPIAK